MSEHIVERKLYYVIFGALMGFTALTVLAAYVDVNTRVRGVTIPFNAFIALTIATIKAVLVVLYFMHVRWSTRLIWVVVAAGFFWLALLLGITMADYLSRPWLTIPD
jgi:cytochrome c oxidase subunit IV